MNDFADWLSPILVKELRQGLRSRVFTIILILIQCFMVMLTMMISEENPTVTNVLFWMALGGVMGVLMPLRAAGALGDEVKLQTMDLLLLTRLSAWKICFGKWCSLYMQSLLLACTILPFFVVRYFSGGIDLVEEFWALLILLLISGLTTAGTVALSAVGGSILSRLVIVIVAFFISISTGAPDALEQIFTKQDSWLLLLPLVCWAIVTILICLELGRKLIAPASENTSTRMRLLSLALLIGGVWALTSSEGYSQLAWLFFAPMIFVIVVSLMEGAPEIATLYRPLTPRWPWLDRVLAWFLLPGWPSGLFFALLVAGVLTCLGSMEVAFNAPAMMVIVATSGAIAVALALTHLAARMKMFSTWGPAAIFSSIFGSMTVLLIVDLVLDGRSYPGSLRAMFFGISPLTWCGRLLKGDSHWLDASLFLIPAVLTVAASVYLMWLAVCRLRAIHRLRQSLETA